MSLNNQTPQLEDGFTRIANEILEALSRTNLTSYQTRILWFIFRKTYGYHKKEDWISVQQIVEGTGIRQSHVSRTKKELTQRGIIYTPNGIKIAFQKDSTRWKDIPNEVYRKKYIPQQVKHIPHKVLNIPHQGNTIDNIQNITTKDNINRIFPFFEKVNPSYKRMFVNTSQRASLKRLVDQYGEERIKNLLLQLPSIIQRPYAPRITTPYELESKMGQLIAFMKQESIKINKGGVTKV